MSSCEPVKCKSRHLFRNLLLKLPAFWLCSGLLHELRSLATGKGAVMSCPNASPVFRETPASGTSTSCRLEGMIGDAQHETRCCCSCYPGCCCCARNSAGSLHCCSTSRRAKRGLQFGSSPTPGFLSIRPEAFRARPIGRCRIRRTSN